MIRKTEFFLKVPPDIAALGYVSIYALNMSQLRDQSCPSPLYSLLLEKKHSSISRDSAFDVSNL